MLVRRMYRDKLSGLVPARAEIHASIAATVPLGTMAGDFAGQSLAAQEGMEALKRNLRSEHILIHEFLSKVFLQARAPASRMGFRFWVGFS